MLRREDASGAATSLPQATLSTVVSTSLQLDDDLEDNDWTPSGAEDDSDDGNWTPPGTVVRSRPRDDSGRKDGETISAPSRGPRGERKIGHHMNSTQAAHVLSMIDNGDGDAEQKESPLELLAQLLVAAYEGSEHVVLQSLNKACASRASRGRLRR